MENRALELEFPLISLTERGKYWVDLQWHSEQEKLNNESILINIHVTMSSF